MVTGMQAESWTRFADAIKFYESKGFRYRDVQWVTFPEYSAVTKPEWCKDIYLGGTDCVLLGSAEQAFIHEYERLDNGLYYAITPCFRDEEEITEYTKHYFMKLELFSKTACVDSYTYLMDCAFKFFKERVPDWVRLEITKTEDFWTRDITYKDVELGSYSLRKHKDMEWVCGTGLAEPRFTAAIKR